MYKIVTQVLVGVLLVSLNTLNSCKDKGSDTIVISTAGQYLNQAVGSNWEYFFNGSSNTITVKVIDSTKMLLAKTYRQFLSTDSTGSSTNYYAYKDGSYYSLYIGSNGKEELIYLKDSNEVGKKWVSVVTSAGFKIPYSYEVIENNLTKIVNGITYNNVVHVKLTIQTTGYIVDSYYSPKVGLIKSDAASSITELKKYTLK